MDEISKTSPMKKTGATKSRGKKSSTIDTANWHQMIAEAAYYNAEARGFEGGHEIDDWLEAEAKISTRQ